MNTKKSRKSPLLKSHWKIAHLKITLQVTLLSLLSLLILPQAVMAAPMDITPINNVILDFGSTLQGLAIPIAVLIFITAGLAMMGGQQGRQWAKPTMLYCAIGYVIVTLAPEIVNIFSATTGQM